MSSKMIKTFCMFMALCLSTSVCAAEEEMTESFESLVNQLHVKSYKKKEGLIEKIGVIDDKRRMAVLENMLNSLLYYRKSDKKIVIVKKLETLYEITDALTNEIVGAVDKSTLKRIKVNNKLRRILRSRIARLSLQDVDADVRLAAVKNLMGNMDESKAALLRERLAEEEDSDVHQTMQTAIALVEIQGEDRSMRLKALAQLSDSLEPVAKTKIEDLLEKDDNDNYLEADKEIIEKAIKGLEIIESRLSVFSFIETAFFGLSLGSVLLLIAIGLAITFGVMGVINMAHGELMMIGAYTTYLVQQAMPNHIDYSMMVAIPAAFVVAGLFGIAIERGVIRHLYGRPLETLLATFGISLILQQLVRTAISAQNVTVANPSWLSGSLVINPALAITYNRLFILIFSLLVFAALVMILKKTPLGLQVRAVSQNRPMARAMGVRSEWVDALTFGLGSGIAGVAGVALSQLTNVGPNMGQAYIIDSFMVVVFGGVGNLWGTFVGAMSLGVFNKFIEPATGAVLAKILVLVLIILFIQKRPRGLFPQKGRAVEN